MSLLGKEAYKTALHSHLVIYRTQLCTKTCYLNKDIFMESRNMHVQILL